MKAYTRLNEILARWVTQHNKGNKVLTNKFKK